MRNLHLKINDAPTLLTKEKAERVAKENHDFGDDVYVVRLYNEGQGLYVVDVLDSETKQVIFTL